MITAYWAAEVVILFTLNNPEGNTLTATEFVRLLEDSGSITAKQSNGTTENTHYLGPTVEFNPLAYS